MRDAVRALSQPHPHLPVGPLLALAAPQRRLTVDLAASQTLGFPLVVLHAAPPGADARFASLTPREREVAAQLAQGRCNKDVAQALGISLGTVKDHVHAVLRKTGCASRLEVACAFTGRQS